MFMVSVRLDAKVLFLLGVATSSLACGDGTTAGNTPRGESGASGYSAGTGGAVAGATTAGGTDAGGGAGSNGGAHVGAGGAVAGTGATGEPGGSGGAAGAGGSNEGEAPLRCDAPIAVASTEELASAVTAAKPGDCIELADGDYAFPIIAARGTEAEPIAIVAKNLLMARVSSGNLALEAAAHVAVQGIHFTSSGNIRIKDCDHCRITRFRIQRAEPEAEVDWVWVSGTSQHCRIDHNELGPQTKLANMIMLAGAGAQIVQYTRIDHNYFHDVEYTGGNGWETIRAGLSGWTFSSAHSLIEHNLFVRADSDPETISIKSSDNVIRYNTMRETAGEFTLRHGNRTAVYGNYILGDGVDNSGGLRVYGGGHQIYDNYIEGVTDPGINVDGGESDDQTGALTDHKVSYDVQVVFNTVVGSTALRVGSGKALKPKNITLAYNILQATGQAINVQSGSDVHSLGNVVAAGTTNVSEGFERVDPLLARIAGILQIGAGSPAVDAADSSFSFVASDIAGRPRTVPDIGAHELSEAPVKYRLLTEQDVGPLAP